MHIWWIRSMAAAWLLASISHSASADDNSDVAAALARIGEARKAVHTVQGELKSRKTELHGEAKEDLGEHRLGITIDYEHNFVRFDGEGPEPLIVEKRSVPNRYKAKFLRNDKQVIEWYDLRAEPVEGSPDAFNLELRPVSDTPPTWFHTADWRVAGLVSERSYASIDKFEQLLASYKGLSNGKLEKLPDGVQKITWTFVNSPLTTSLWLDPRQGGNPVRYELAPADKSAPVITGESKWEKIKNVWLPKSFFVVEEMLDGGRAKGKVNKSRFEGTFQWKKVNEPLERDLFDFAGIDLPGTTQIYDLRKDKQHPPRVGILAEHHAKPAKPAN